MISQTATQNLKKKTMFISLKLTTSYFGSALEASLSLSSILFQKIIRRTVLRHVFLFLMSRKARNNSSPLRWQLPTGRSGRWWIAAGEVVRFLYPLRVNYVEGGRVSDRLTIQVRSVYCDSSCSVPRLW